MWAGKCALIPVKSTLVPSLWARRNASSEGEMRLTVDIERFCLLIFFDTRSLISLKSPLIHNLSCRPVVGLRVILCMCAFTPVCRMFDHRFPGECSYLSIMKTSELYVCEHLHVFVFHCPSFCPNAPHCVVVFFFCNVLYTLSCHIWTIKQDMRLKTNILLSSSWFQFVRS